MYRSTALFCLLLLFTGCTERVVSHSLYHSFTGPADTEIGNHYTGLAFHNGGFLPQRISFYSPLANSLDQSTDFWHRDTTYVARLGYSVDEKELNWIGQQSDSLVQSPFSLTAYYSNKNTRIQARYRFPKNDAAVFVEYEFQNLSDTTRLYRIDNLWSTALHTCHTYQERRPNGSTIQQDSNAISMDFDYQDTGLTSLFLLNLASPGVPNISAQEMGFHYEKNLAPGQKMQIILVLGQCDTAAKNTLFQRPVSQWQRDIAAYEQAISQYARQTIVQTGEPAIDQTTVRAAAVIATNRHYIDGHILSAPCPAEYNFFFTHDMLVNNLAVSYFDPPLVRRELDWLLSKADSAHTIPHAYYWKDSTFVTEFVDQHNWNNFWFIILCGQYLKRSNDLEFLEHATPFLQKSLALALSALRDDGLFWAKRPDWWDAGNNIGPRAYMGILAYKALQEYLYIGTRLEFPAAELVHFEAISEKIKYGLNNKLWDAERGYLMNYLADGSQDPHYYIGSLLAEPFGLIDPDQGQKLVATANNKLLDPNVGIYNAYPMNFHTLTELFDFVPGEVGAPFFYFNGGIWPQGNAWYAMALNQQGRSEECYDFIRKIMTIDGLCDSPNGQPAFYEVRCSNKTNMSEYGTVDKPQFLWAAGWYIKTIYHFSGLAEDSWNTVFAPHLPADIPASHLTVFANGIQRQIQISGNRPTISAVIAGAVEYPAAMLNTSGVQKKVHIHCGTPTYPILTKVNAVLESARFLKPQSHIQYQLNSFSGHLVALKIISPVTTSQILINGKPTDFIKSQKQGVWEYVVIFKSESGLDTIEVII